MPVTVSRVVYLPSKPSRSPQRIMPYQKLSIGLCFWQVGHFAMAETLNHLWWIHMLSSPYMTFIPTTTDLLLMCPLCQHCGGINMVTLPDHSHMSCASTLLYFYLLIFLFPSPLTTSQVISHYPWVLSILNWGCFSLHTKVVTRYTTWSAEVGRVDSRTTVN